VFLTKRESVRRTGFDPHDEPGGLGFGLLRSQSLLPKTPGNILHKVKETYVVWLALLATAVFCSSACAFASRPAVLDPRATDAKAPASSASEADSIARACDLILQGKFDAAGQLVKKATGAGKSQQQLLEGLTKITDEYEAICKRRQSAQEAAEEGGRQRHRRRQRRRPERPERPKRSVRGASGYQ
jgi:hypothetical protein